MASSAQNQLFAFFVSVLNGLGIAPNANNLRDLVGWQHAEGGWFQDPDMFNPFNTTQPEPGSHGTNSVNVQSYTSFAQGVQATVRTLKYPAYGGIVADLAFDPSEADFAATVGHSPWGTPNWDPGGTANTTTGPGPTTTGTSGTGATVPASDPNAAILAQNKQSAQTDAITQVETALQAFGLASLGAWAYGEAIHGKSGDQIMLDLQNTPQFEARFPGLKERVKNGYPSMSAAEYLTYEATAMQMARAAGLPNGFMTNKEVSNLVANDVSTDELSQRITNGYVAAMNSTAETRTLLHNYYGVNTGNLAAYYLNPKTAVPLLERQLNQAQIGGEGVQAGFSEFASRTSGTFLTNQLEGLGVTPSEARGTFKQIAPELALTKGAPGGPPQGMLNQNEILSAAFNGDQASQRAVQVAGEARTAPFKGGGGGQTTAKGALGVGSASEVGQQGT